MTREPRISSRHTHLRFVSTFTTAALMMPAARLHSLRENAAVTASRMLRRTSTSSCPPRPRDPHTLRERLVHDVLHQALPTWDVEGRCTPRRRGRRVRRPHRYVNVDTERVAAEPCEGIVMASTRSRTARIARTFSYNVLRIDSVFRKMPIPSEAETARSNETAAKKKKDPAQIPFDELGPHPVRPTVPKAMFSSRIRRYFHLCFGSIYSPSQNATVLPLIAHNLQVLRGPEAAAGKIRDLLSRVGKYRPGSICARDYGYRGEIGLLRWDERGLLRALVFTHPRAHRPSGASNFFAIVCAGTGEWPKKGQEDLLRLVVLNLKKGGNKGDTTRLATWSQAWSLAWSLSALNICKTVGGVRSEETRTKSLKSIRRRRRRISILSTDLEMYWVYWTQYASTPVRGTGAMRASPKQAG
ncbi:hypothetical protein EDB85DRAFT_2279271 [Lactarius pseudohatsudake]|nr:hypothetical protein EDB85DRAFT_2279271 [Lactarius pseudohatsudake]